MCGVVDRGLVEVDDHGRRQVLIIAGLIIGRPGLVSERFVEPSLRQRVDREAVCPVFDRRLHSDFGVEQVALWNGLRSQARR